MKVKAVSTPTPHVFISQEAERRDEIWAMPFLRQNEKSKKANRSV